MLSASRGGAERFPGAGRRFPLSARTGPDGALRRLGAGAAGRAGGALRRRLAALFLVIPVLLPACGRSVRLCGLIIIAKHNKKNEDQ